MSASSGFTRIQLTCEGGFRHGAHVVAPSLTHEDNIESESESESVPLAKLKMYKRVTLRPCTRPPGCTLDITQKTELAFRCFTQG